MYQWDRLKIPTKIKSLQSQHIRGRNVNNISGTARTMIPYCEELTQILETDHANVPSIVCTAHLHKWYRVMIVVKKVAVVGDRVTYTWTWRSIRR